MASSTRPQISIIIPGDNGGPAFRAGLESLELFLPAQNVIATEVIILADGCTDESADLAQKSDATLLSTAPAGNPARARNLGVTQAQGEILFFIDTDVTIQGDTLAQVASLFVHEPQVAATIGSYDDAPGPSNFLSQYKNLLHHYTHQTAQADASTFLGNCGAIRRDIFGPWGGDERYRKPLIKDIELGHCLKQPGYNIHFCKTFYIKHLKRWELVPMLRAEFFYRALPWTELLLNQQQPMNDLSLKLSTQLSVVLVFCLVLLPVMGWWCYLNFWMAALLGLLLTGLNASVHQVFTKSEVFGLLCACYLCTGYTSPTAA